MAKGHVQQTIRNDRLRGRSGVIRDSIEERRGSSSREEQRLELALRTRSLRLRGRTGSVGRCSGCGRPVASHESWMSVGSLVVHPECLFG
jgi:hypothetical protein